VIFLRAFFYFLDLALTALSKEEGDRKKGKKTIPFSEKDPSKGIPLSKGGKYGEKGILQEWLVLGKGYFVL